MGTPILGIDEGVIGWYGQGHERSTYSPHSGDVYTPEGHWGEDDVHPVFSVLQVQTKLCVEIFGGDSSEHS